MAVEFADYSVPSSVRSYAFVTSQPVPTVAGDPPSATDSGFWGTFQNVIKTVTTAVRDIKETGGPVETTKVPTTPAPTMVAGVSTKSWLIIGAVVLVIILLLK